MSRRLTPEERIQARHLLQVLAEHARSIRNAMDPAHGMPSVTAAAWESQWEDLTGDLDAFTDAMREGRPYQFTAPGADRNTAPHTQFSSLNDD